MTRKSRPGALLALLLFVSSAVAEDFPLPDELRPDVDFWIDIFTEYTTNQGVLHDNRRLGVVYEVIDYRADQGRRDRQRVVRQRRDRLVKALRSLATGRRDNLTAIEQQALAAWPDGVSNAELTAAAGRIRHQQGLRNRFREGLERSGRWRDYIEAEFTALGVPLDLAALPHVESSYNPAARSHVGASGIWQFTRSTGRRFMRVDHVVDDRNDPFASARAAGQLLAYNYSLTGNWPMAITAYNHGLAGARRAMRQHGDSAYADIMRNYKGRTFGFASRNFYVAFLAARHVDQNAEQYFSDLVIEPAARHDEIVLDAYVSARDLGDALGMSQRQLERHNPALQATVWQGSKHIPKGFTVRLPPGTLDAPASDLMANLPAAQRHAEQLPDMFHTVARGDTLSQIAETYDTRVSTLVALNGLSSSHRIRAGQELRLPAAGPAPAVVAAARVPIQDPSPPPPPAAEPEPEPAIVAAAEPEVVEEVTPAALADETVATPAPAAAPQTALLSDPSDYGVADDGTIEVQPLETLGHYGDWLEIRTQRLRDLNGLAFRTPVEVGRRLRLDLGTVDAATFESRRIAYHRRQQDAYFRQHQIAGFTEHVISRGESIWILSLREYDVPIWLFRQYNPDVDLDSIRPGMTVRFPTMMPAP